MLRSKAEKLQLPPRKVPFLVYVQSLFGGLIPQIAWFILVMILLISWDYVLKIDWQSVFFEILPVEYKYGTVYEPEPTKFIDYDNSTPSKQHYIYAYRYEFNVDGRDYNGISYSANSKLAGENIFIEYLSWNNALSRVKGERSSPFPMDFKAQLFCDFLAFALVFIVHGLILGYRTIHLLKNGVFGDCIHESSKIVGNFQVSLFQVDFWKVVMRFIGPMGKIYKTRIITDAPEVLQDDPVELALCDPADPRRFVPVDAIPGGLIIDEFGVIRHAGIPHVIIVSILPLSALLLFIYHILSGLI